MIRRVLAVVAGVLVILTFGGWGRIEDAREGYDSDAGSAVRALTSGAELTLPSGFAAARGYSPSVVRLPSGDLRPVAPEGGCSSPLGDAGYGFTDACREHDLGYDLLRYASTEGQPLGAWARRAIDAEFTRQIMATCDGPDCRRTAAVYVAAVEFNSWRQGYGVPGFESLWQLISPVLAGLAVTIGLLLMPRRWWNRLGWPAATATGLLVVVLPPRLLPHPLSVDVAVGALTLLLGYAAAVLAGRAVRRIRPTPLPRLPGSATLTTLFVAATVLRTQYRHDLLTTRLDLGATPSWHALAVVAGAAVTATVLWWTAAGVRRVLARVPRRRLVLTITLPVLVLALASATPGPDGSKQATFLGGLRPAGQISAVTHRLATTPTRVYVASDEAESTWERAELAVERAVRAGAARSKAVLVVIPTGSGWVNDRVVGLLEQLYDGDLTTVAVQYASVPSWLAYLKGGAGVRESAEAVITAMRDRLDREAAEHRPDLLVYGESLGAWGALPSVEAGLADAALLTGVPQRLQVSGAGRAVLNHDDDPVPGWTWRASPVSFLRTTADVIAAENAPVGHGHRYGADTEEAWCSLLELPTCA